jgi:hypothetical protein
MPGEHFEGLHGFLVRHAAEVYLENWICQAKIQLSPLEAPHTSFRGSENDAIAAIEIVIGSAAEKFREAAFIFLIVRGLPRHFLIERGEKTPVLGEMPFRDLMRFFIAVCDIKMIDAKHFTGSARPIRSFPA